MSWEAYTYKRPSSQTRAEGSAVKMWRTKGFGAKLPIVAGPVACGSLGCCREEAHPINANA